MAVESASLTEQKENNIHIAGGLPLIRQRKSAK
jgi:hypothetical protein